MNQSKKNSTKKYKDTKIILKEVRQIQQFSEVSKSDFSFEEVMDMEEFANLSQQINLKADQRQRLIDSLYSSSRWNQDENKFRRQRETQISQYERQFQKWKGSQNYQNDYRSTYASTLALVNKKTQKEELNRLIRQFSVDKAIYKYDNTSPQLSQISKSHENSLIKAMKQQRKFKKQANVNYQSKVESKQKLYQQKKYQKQSTDNIYYHQKIQDQERKRTLIQLQVQKQLLNKIKKINDQQQRLHKKQQKQKLLTKQCFVSMIQKPPSFLDANYLQRSQKIEKELHLLSKSNQNDAPIKVAKKQSNLLQIKQTKQNRYKLNILQLLKIPHKQFLIFYSQNYNQIVSLTTPDQLNKINSYREEALSRQQAFQKLKKKVAEEGSLIVQKLPSYLREKLFKVLYEKDVEQEKYYQNKMYYT